MRQAAAVILKAKRKPSTLLPRAFALTLSLAAIQAQASTAFSTLTSDAFSSQIDLPRSETIPAGSLLDAKIKEAYSKLNVSPGERIRYTVTYMGVNAGDAEVLLQRPVKFGSGWAHRITAEVKSASWYSWLVKLYDSAEELSTEAEEFTPVRFYLNQIEKDYESTKLLEYNPTALSVRQRSKRSGKSEVQKEFQYPKGTKEALGALYYLRSQLASSFPPPLHLEFPIFTSEKTWTGKASYRGSDTRKIANTKYETDVYHLITTFGGLMEQKGDIRIWFTRDELKIPIYIEAYLKFGYIKVTLDEWDPGEIQKTKFKPIRHDL